MNDLLVNPLATAADAIAYLDRVYNDPQEQQRAAAALSRLRQGSDAFETFYAEFERLLALAGGSVWPEDIKMQYLRSATHASIVLPNVASDNSTTLDELASQYRKIAMGIAAVKAPNVTYATQGQTTQTQPNVSYNYPMTTTDGTVPMDIDVSNTQVRGFGGRGRGGAHVGGRRSRVNPDGGPGPGLPTDARLQGRRAVRIDQAEYRRRRDANACLRCGRRGCYVAVCPLAASAPIAAVGTIQANNTYVEPDLDGVYEAEPTAGQGKA